MKSANLGVVLVLAALVTSSLDDEMLRAGELGIISGRVTSAKDNKPLPYANIVLVGTTMGAMSLGDGRYELKGVPPGTYTVKCMMMGFASDEKKGIVVGAGDQVTVSFALSEKVVAQIQEIRVTADKAMVEVETEVSKGRFRACRSTR